MWCTKVKEKATSMKIVICGKVDVEYIVSLLAEQYAQSGRRVLVVDTDESNAGLHRTLGPGLQQTCLNTLAVKTHDGIIPADTKKRHPVVLCLVN